MTNLAWFGTLYGCSMIPWLAAFWIKNKDSQWGLFLMDGALTIASTVFFWWALGWWLVLFIMGSLGFGYVLRGLGLYSYTTLEEDRLRKREARKAKQNLGV